MTENKLLGNHKPSSEWYTPDHIWNKVYNTFGITKGLFDPCPINSTINGFKLDWDYKYVYCNPPTPAQPWAKKALQTVKQNPETVIIFACFSEAVIWQVNDLLNYPMCWVRNRIPWIDGNKWVKKPNGDSTGTMIDGKIWYPNTQCMKPAKSPRNYNAFVLLVNDNNPFHSNDLIDRFCEQFSDMGTIQLGRFVYGYH